MADAGKDPSYPWYPRDHDADEPVKMMSIAAEGAYRRLLDHQWLHGSIPGDTKLQAKICKGIPEREMKKLWLEISPCFEPLEEGKRYQNQRLERIRLERKQHREQQSKAGKLGAEKRWHGHGDPNSNPNGEAIGSATDPPMANDSSALALALASDSSGPNGPGGPGRRAESTDATAGQIMARIRKRLYAPDGRPPPDWTEAREFSLIQEALKHHTGEEILRIVEGLRLLIDSAQVDWLPPGSKASLRAAYAHTGVLAMWGQAEDAYYRAAGTTSEEKRQSYRRAAAEVRERPPEAASTILERLTHP